MLYPVIAFRLGSLGYAFHYHPGRTEKLINSRRLIGLQGNKAAITLAPRRSITSLTDWPTI